MVHDSVSRAVRITFDYLISILDPVDESAVIHPTIVLKPVINFRMTELKASQIHSIIRFSNKLYRK